jgi:hypothetical protein
VESLVITWRELLIVAIVVLGVYAAEMLLLLRWSANRGTNVWKRAAQTAPDPQRLTAMSLEVSELRKQVARLESEVEKLRAGGTPASSPYNQAILMARQGVSASDVASTCGISRGEAELIVALYRKLRI